MKTLMMLLAPVALAALLSPAAPVEDLGKPMPPDSISGLAQTKAKSVDDYAGRAVLVEFFAYT